MNSNQEPGGQVIAIIQKPFKNVNRPYNSAEMKRHLYPLKRRGERIAIMAALRMV
jgi:hypothetical protein